MSGQEDEKVFSNAELSVDAVLASACLPLSFQAVEIDGEAYWDGGYSGNPAIAPLFKETPVDNVIIIGVNPLETRPELPKTAGEIIDRINEITFSTALFLELEAVKYVLALPGRDHEDHPLKNRHPRLHEIHAEELREFGASSKLNNELRFLRHLHAIGRRTAAVWIDAHLDAVGKDSTLEATLTAPSVLDQ